MAKCPLCGFDGELVDAITDEEIIKICNLCAEKNNLPIIKKPTLDQTRYEHRFVRPSDRKDFEAKRKRDIKIEKELKAIVTSSVRAGNYDDLIDNFHWHIQQARRMKKISQKQMAESIAEPEVIVTMAEKAQLPENYEKIISKFEQFLGIQLRKNPSRVLGIEQGVFDIKKANLSQVTIRDLRELQMAKEFALIEKEDEEGQNEISDDSEITDDEEENKESQIKKDKLWKKIKLIDD